MSESGDDDKDEVSEVESGEVEEGWLESCI